jgi:LacI family transcriptional regulator
MVGRPSILYLTDLHYALQRSALLGILAYAREKGGWSVYAEQPQPSGVGDFVRHINACGILCSLSGNDAYPELWSIDVPIVNLLDDPVDGRVVVTADNPAIGRAAAEHFLERGFRNLAFCGFWRHSFNVLRGDGFDRAARARGVLPVFYFAYEDPNSHDDFAKLGQWLLSLRKPVGVMASNDLLARTIVRACDARDIRVPEDVAVIGVDNDEMACATSATPLSSVPVQAERIGYGAAAALDALMAGRTPESMLTLIPPGPVVVRRSSDIAAVEDAEVSAAMTLIRDHPTGNLSVKELLAKLNLSRRGLELRFRRALGRTPFEEIRLARLRRAQALLTETDLTVGEIAFRVGFENSQPLSTLFQIHLGLSPTQYRRQHRRL